jgi:hypothetical protein
VLHVPTDTGHKGSRMTTPRERIDQWQARGHLMWATAGQCYYLNDAENPVDPALIEDASAHHAEMCALLTREPMLSGYAPGATRTHLTVVVGAYRHWWLCGLGAPSGDGVTDAPPPHDARRAFGRS